MRSKLKPFQCSSSSYIIQSVGIHTHTTKTDFQSKFTVNFYSSGSESIGYRSRGKYIFFGVSAISTPFIIRGGALSVILLSVDNACNTNIATEWLKKKTISSNKNINTLVPRQRTASLHRLDPYPPSNGEERWQ